MRVRWYRFRRAQETGARAWGSEGQGGLGKRAEAGHWDPGLGRGIGVLRAEVKGDPGWILGPRLEQENWGPECRGQKGWGWPGSYSGSSWTPAREASPASDPGSGEG